MASSGPWNRLWPLASYYLPVDFLMPWSVIVYIHHHHHL